MYTWFGYLSKSFTTLSREYFVLRHQAVRLISSPILTIIWCSLPFRTLPVSQAGAPFKALTLRISGSPSKCYRDPFFTISIPIEQISISYQFVLFFRFLFGPLPLISYPWTNSNDHNCHFCFSIWANLGQSNIDGEICRGQGNWPVYKSVHRRALKPKEFLERLHDTNNPPPCKIAGLVSDKAAVEWKAKAVFCSRWRPVCSATATSSCFENWQLNK